MTSEHLLTPSDVAEQLSLPRLRVERMARAGEIPAIAVTDRELRFRASDIDQWIEHRRINGGGASR